MSFCTVRANFDRIIQYMDTNNPIIKLCIEGTQAEYAGRMEDAAALYQKAWELATDDYEACVAAHYIAHIHREPAEIFRWNQVALTCAEATEDERVTAFYPSLYLNMGRSYELIGNLAEAQKYYALAAELGAIHQDK